MLCESGPLILLGYLTHRGHDVLSHSFPQLKSMSSCCLLHLWETMVHAILFIASLLSRHIVVQQTGSLNSSHWLWKSKLMEVWNNPPFCGHNRVLKMRFFLGSEYARFRCFPIPNASNKHKRITWLTSSRPCLILWQMELINPQSFTTFAVLKVGLITAATTSMYVNW